MIGYGITLKVSKSKYKIRYYFMGSTLIFQFLYINALNYYHFHTECSTFLKIKNVYYNYGHVIASTGFSALLHVVRLCRLEICALCLPQEEGQLVGRSVDAGRVT